MITATFFHKNKSVQAFEISGHAESGPYGYDLVCAGVSAISFGMVNAISALCKIEMDIVQESSGYLQVTIPDDLSRDVRERVQLLLEGMMISLETMEREYSQFITIKRK